MKKLLKGLKGKKKAQRKAAILALSEPKPVVKVWRGCARTNATLVTLAKRAGTPIGEFEDRIHAAIGRTPFEPVTLIDDAERPLIFYVKENGARFRGVRIAKRTLRDYPAYDVARHVGYAAQIFGTIGEVTTDDLKDAETYPGAKSGDVVGHSGIERSYDRWLRGRDGTLNVTVDAQGNPQGRATLVPAPVPGRDVRLTIDLDLQHAAEKALRKGIATARERGGPDGAPMPRAARGALIIMDVKTGAVRAMASWPSFDNKRTVGKGSDAYFAKLFSRANRERAPLLNRTTDGIYPPGSTFKPVTAIASIATGVSTVSDEILCGKDLVVDGQRYKNFETDTNTFISLRTALTQSCDTYFYELGNRLYKATSKNGDRQPQPLWMRRLGFGAPTGLDIPDAAGVAPDAEYKKELFGKDPINNKWTSGDAVNASIGQGFVQVTPLQMASLYALIANGGSLVTPHLADTIEDPGGEVVKELRFKARRKVDVDPFVLESIRSGLRGVTHDVDGTAATRLRRVPRRRRRQDRHRAEAAARRLRLVRRLRADRGSAARRRRRDRAGRLRRRRRCHRRARRLHGGVQRRVPASCRRRYREKQPVEKARVADHQRRAARRSRGTRDDRRAPDDRGHLLPPARLRAARGDRRRDRVRLRSRSSPSRAPRPSARHLIYVGIGVTLALLVATVDLRLYRKILWPGYVALLLLLMLVLGLEAARGSSRWITLPRVQPAAVRDRQGDRDRRAGGAGRRAQPRQAGHLAHVRAVAAGDGHPRRAGVPRARPRHRDRLRRGVALDPVRRRRPPAADRHGAGGRRGRRAAGVRRAARRPASACCSRTSRRA